jgi:hypothetical protein
MGPPERAIRPEPTDGSHKMQSINERYRARSKESDELSRYYTRENVVEINAYLFVFTKENA